MKRITGFLLATLMVCSMIGPMTLFTASAAKVRELPTAAGSILRDATYVVSKDTRIVGGAGRSALVVSGNVTITIKEGATLTVIGGDANGATGAGAGIEVPAGASLTINGDGTLKATGGKAAAGGKGGNGADGAVYDKNDPYEHLYKGKDWCYSGAGGVGGNGGGGGGAGIGTKGGNGGKGGGGGDGLSKVASSGSADSAGLAGSDGSPGSESADCGNICICKTLDYTITGGGASIDPSSGGDKGKKGSHEWYFTYIGFGGGGGGAGGNGYPGAKVGTGGGGGDGGGGGGSGIIIHWYYTSSINACEGTGGGGKGGSGYFGNGLDGATATTSNNDGRTPGAGGGSKINSFTGNGIQKLEYEYELVADLPQLQNKSFVYDGTPKTVVEAGNGYTFTDGKTATNVGTYTVTAALRRGYRWPNGYGTKTLTWSIIKQPVEIPSSVSLCYNGREHTAYTEKPLYTVENAVKTDAGNYEAIFRLKDSNNYKWEDEQKALGYNKDPNDKKYKGMAIVPYDIHYFTDENADGVCDKCGGTDRYRYNSVSYLDKKIDSDNTVITEKKTCAIARRISQYDAEWGIAGETVWYVVDENVVFEDTRPVVKGDVRIILENKKTLTAKQGIALEEGNSISFYAQSDDKDTAGTLNIDTTDQTGIGGHNGETGAKGAWSYNFDGSYGGGERGKDGSNAGEVYIYGGNYNLKSFGAVCIGGGNGGNGGIGSETADEGKRNAGNGGDGGTGGNANSVYFYGGVVSMKSDIGCIGGGKGGTGGNGGEGSADGRTPFKDGGFAYPNHGIGGNGGTGGNAGEVHFYDGTFLFESDYGCVGGGNGGDGGNGSNSGGVGGRAGNGGNGGDGSKTLFFGGDSTFKSKNAAAVGRGKGGTGGNGCYGPGQDGNSETFVDGCFAASDFALVLVGGSAEEAAATDAYRGQNYLSVQYYHVWQWLDARTHKCADCDMVTKHIDDGNGICTLCGKPCVVLIPEEAPTCGGEGHIAYYKCDGKYYFDIDCTQEITDLEDWLKNDGSIARLPHTYSDKWSYNEDFHWHWATCPHTGLRGDLAGHTLNEDYICTVCGRDCSDLMVTGSVFSKPGFWGAVTVAVVILGGVVALIIVKKKKKPIS